MRTCIIETNKGRAGWSQMYCSRIGRMTLANTERFWNHDETEVFEAVEVEQRWQATCPACLRRARK